MQIRNDYNKVVFNGDIGVIVSIPRDKDLIDQDDEDDDAPSDTWDVAFGNRILQYTKTDIDDLRLAGAISIHKSQGSEFPIVIIPVTTAHFIMLKRNLIYTGLTRGKVLVILVGQKRALAMAVRNVDDSKRITKLREWLTGTQPLTGQAAIPLAAKH
jgi:exodeoxyribonuclease V alpha subunit